MFSQSASRGNWRPRPRLMLVAGFGLVLSFIFSFAIHAHRAAHNMPDVEAVDEIAAAQGGYQRDSIAPVLCVLTDGWVMEYGPVIHVWYRTPMTEAKMAPLVKLGELEELTVVSPRNDNVLPFTDPVIPSEPGVWRRLAELTSLRRVCIIHTDIRDDDLVHLYKLPRLRRIDLWKNPNLTHDGVDRLRKAQPKVHINYP